MAVQITCINKDNGNHENPYLAISHLGWLNESTGEIGKCSRIEMYDYLEKGGLAYVLDRADGSKAYLETDISPAGTKYVHAEANNTTRDNLLSLDECR